MRRLLPVLALLSCVVCGCSSSPKAVKAPYTPIPDSVLFARIATLPGVVRSDLTWVNRFGDSNSYGGQVRVRAGVDGVHILDSILAILRQGRAGAFYGAVEILEPRQFAITPTDFGLWSQADYTARYGPQPGTGVPPSTPLNRRR